MPCRPIRNEAGATLRELGTELTIGAEFAVDRAGRILIGGIVPGTSATSLGKAEDALHVSGDTGIAVWGVSNASRATTFGGNLDYTPIAVDNTGGIFASLFSTGDAFNPVRTENSSIADGSAVMMGGLYTQTTLSQTANDAQAGWAKADLLGALWTRITIPAALTTTTPTVATATSVTIAAANTNRKYLFIQNNTAANIMISLSNAVLTGIIPSATNIGIVIPPTGVNYYETPPNIAPNAAITCYQTSGGSVNTITVIEG